MGFVTKRDSMKLIIVYEMRVHYLKQTPVFFHIYANVTLLWMLVFINKTFISLFFLEKKC